jgi:crotonobetainyl-CoA:carnitine CoA-transferase CaiB-like acyl-CoA transferase
VLGTHPAETHAIRVSDLSPELRTPAPRLGEHTDHVLHDLLGMPADEVASLRAAGVLE